MPLSFLVHCLQGVLHGGHYQIFAFARARAKHTLTRRVYRAAIAGRVDVRGFFRVKVHDDLNTLSDVVEHLIS
jgi:hypothetical protein